MTTEIDYEARVAKGIALLDEKVPDWADRIDLDRLDVAHGGRCVTAQVSGATYVEGMRLLGLEHDAYATGSYTDHGFMAEGWDAEGMPPGYAQMDGYAVLNPIWHREIAARQEAADETDNTEETTA